MNSVNTDAQPNGRERRARRSRHLLIKAAVFALLVAVAGLSTLAKNSLYYPKTNPSHYVSIASKARIASAPAVEQRAPMLPMVRMTPPQTLIRTAAAPHEGSEAPPILEIGIVLSLQHRSPPTSLL
jgi:hypothetical protein